MTTANPTYSPWSLLPAPEPRTDSPPADYFYQNVAKHLIKDTVRIMSNGLGIDLNEVNNLETTIDDSISKVYQSLQTSPIIAAYLDRKYSNELAAYKAERASMLRSIDYYLKPFNHKDMIHRSYFMHLYSKSQGFTGPPDEVYPGISKWDAKTVKKLSTQYPILSKLLNGTLSSHPLVTQAMQLLAQHKCDLYNQKFLDQITNPQIPKPEFNPRSPDAKHLVFTDICGYESGKLTDGYKKYERELDKAQKRHQPLPKEPKNKWSWGRKQLEALLDTLTDENEIQLFKDMIEFSFGDKIKSSFIPAFYQYTIDGRLYSNLKLLGTKSARYSSSSPNMLQLPSTGSIYAKPVKKCFVASPGNVILTADFNALEDRVIASITKDPNKTMLQIDPELDGHLFHATMYFKKDFERICGPLPHREMVIKAKELMEAGNKEIKELRQRSKAVTFGASYGAFPPKIAASIGCSLEQAEEIFNAYHNDLYPKITEYRENYVLPTAKENGKLHLALGFYIHTDDSAKDIRTIANASIQAWSLLSILAINELHRRIDSEGLQDKVRVISSIYDSVYIECQATPDIIKWVNDNLIECMTRDFMLDQTVPNEAQSEISDSWSDLITLSNNASIDEINEALKIIKLRQSEA